MKPQMNISRNWQSRSKSSDESIRGYIRLYRTMGDFGQGALRKSARELLIEVDAVQRNISSNVKHIQQKSRYQKFL